MPDPMIKYIDCDPNLFTTSKVEGELLTSGHNWKTGGFGYDANGSPLRANIKECIQYATKHIYRSTDGIIQPNMLTLVMTPLTAYELTMSMEIICYLKQAYLDLAELRGESNPNRQQGLPARLYSLDLSIETQINHYLIPDNTAYMLPRQDQLPDIKQIMDIMGWCPQKMGFCFKECFGRYI